MLHSSVILKAALHMVFFCVSQIHSSLQICDIILSGLAHKFVIM